MKEHVNSLKSRREKLIQSIDNLKRLIVYLENDVKKITQSLIKHCPHEKVDEIRSYDGHKYQKEWWCEFCSSYLPECPGENSHITVKYH